MMLGGPMGWKEWMMMMGTMIMFITCSTNDYCNCYCYVFVLFFELMIDDVSTHYDV